MVFECTFGHSIGKVGKSESNTKPVSDGLAKLSGIGSVDFCFGGSGNMVKMAGMTSEVHRMTCWGPSRDFGGPSNGVHPSRILQTFRKASASVFSCWLS